VRSKNKGGTNELVFVLSLGVSVSAVVKTDRGKNGEKVYVYFENLWQHIFFGVSTENFIVNLLTIFLGHITFNLQFLLLPFNLFLINHLITEASGQQFVYKSSCVVSNKSILNWTKVCQLLRYSS